MHALALLLFVAGCADAPPVQGYYLGTFCGDDAGDAAADASGIARWCVVGVGQSNVSGPVGTSTLAHPERVHELRLDGTWNAAPTFGNRGVTGGPWANMQQNWLSEPRKIADVLAGTFDNVAFISAGLSGSQALLWRPTNATHLWPATMALADECVTQGYELALVVHQGESNATSDALADTWGTYWSEGLTDWRARYGSAPVIVVVLPPTGPTTGYPSWSRVRANQAAWCAANGVTCVQAPDGPWQGTGIPYFHLTWAAIGVNATNVAAVLQ